MQRNVLFVADLSVREFIYLQSYLVEFAKVYPQTSIDLIIHPQNPFLLRYKKSFQIKILQDIFKEQTTLNKIYFEPGNLQKIIREAQTQKYESIVLLDRQAKVKNIELALKLNPKSLLIGTTAKTRWFNFFKKRAYKCLNYSFEVGQTKKIDLENFYSNLFSYLIGKDQKTKPVLHIPKKWIIYAKLKFLKWGIDKKGKRFGRVFFINPFDDDGNYKIQLKTLFSAISKLKQNDEWNDVNFIVHTPPKKFDQVKKFFAIHSINNLFLLTPDYDFFQLPAVLSLCDVVFTVDGLFTDIANAFNIPVTNDFSNQFYNLPGNQ